VCKLAWPPLRLRKILDIRRQNREKRASALGTGYFAAVRPQIFECVPGLIAVVAFSQRDLAYPFLARVFILNRELRVVTTVCVSIIPDRALALIVYPLVLCVAMLTCANDPRIRTRDLYVALPGNARCEDGSVAQVLDSW